MTVSDQRRSVKLANLAPLGDHPRVQFISLQTGAPAAELHHPPHPLAILDPGPLQDFADTAALIARLDLVITVDTAVAHLAGALGRPVWMLSRADGCWRWLTGRDDSPWYPSMRLYRQAQPLVWAPVIERVRQDLHAAGRSAHSRWMTGVLVTRPRLIVNASTQVSSSSAVLQPSVNDNADA